MAWPRRQLIGAMIMAGAGGAGEQSLSLSVQAAVNGRPGSSAAAALH